MEQVAVPVGTSGSRGFSAVASTVLIGQAALELALWIPQYLTWPWSSDHDVFATMALAWSHGLRPYRDLVGDNFPGTIYLFWIVGKLAGWGNVLAYNAFDAILLGVLGLATLCWSWRRFGGCLPGAVTLLALVTYYINLDFSVVAQRDWHAALFVALAMIVLEATSSAAGLLLSATLGAVGFSIRPQVLMFVPGLLWGAWAALPPGATAGGLRTVRSLARVLCRGCLAAVLSNLSRGFSAGLPPGPLGGNARYWVRSPDGEKAPGDRHAYLCARSSVDFIAGVGGPLASW